MVWDEEAILLLKELWTQGHSTAEIGRRLDVTKNAIVGKAHRLELASRPSPIRRDGAVASVERPPSSQRVEGPTLPPLASAFAQVAVSNIQAIRASRAAAVAPPAAPTQRLCRSPAPPVQGVMPSMPPPHRRSAPSCCWPIGEPGKRDFRFCDDQSMPGKPYCEEHAKLAYVKIRDRKEDAA